MIYCYQCEYFDRTGHENYHCKNPDGLVFPGPGDYCSRAKEAVEELHNNKALEEKLKSVYQLRAMSKT